MSTTLRRATLPCLIALLGAAGLACSEPDEAGGKPVEQVRVQVSPDQGATIEHPGGARLEIPPGALSDATEVTITRRPWNVSFDDSSFPIARPFEVDLGDTEIQEGAEILLYLEYPENPFDEDVFQTDHLLLAHDDGEGNTWLRPVTVDEQHLEIYTDVADYLKTSEEDSTATVRTFVTEFVAPIELTEPTPILQVPYYWQDGLPYCAPTSLAMVLNFHTGTVGGLVSNWRLAAWHNQNDDQGAWPYALMRDAGAPKDLYDYRRWDADLIPSNPFTDYVKMQTQGYNLSDILGEDLLGFFGIPDKWVPPRPVQLASTQTNHAFTAVGTSEDSIWLHDSSGAFTGSASIATELSWDQFRTIAVDDTSSKEVHTMKINASPRPREERRGSIEMREEPNSSLWITYGATAFESHWQWDGDPWSKGYYWDDPMGTFVDDGTYGNLIPTTKNQESATLHYSVAVDNVTALERTYSLVVAIRDNASGVTLFDRSHSVTEAAYTRGSPVNDTIDLSQVVPGTGAYSLTFYLYESGVLQDAKVTTIAIE